MNAEDRQALMGRIRTLPQTWSLGHSYINGVEYQTLNPPRKEPKTRKLPPVEKDVAYGPFLIVQVFRTSDRPRDIAPWRLGYILRHAETGASWPHLVCRNVPDARGLAAYIAEAFNYGPTLAPAEETAS